MFTRLLTVFYRWLSRVIQLLSTLGRKHLYVSISQNGEVKIGTCRHCVVDERGRPARAWVPDGDKDLDFERDALIQMLAAYGLQISIEQEYVCP